MVDIRQSNVNGRSLANWLAESMSVKRNSSPTEEK
jgi:hypothetical protein